MDKQTQKRINRNNRKRGGNFEKRVADYLGFEVVPYSGSNARFGYGDVRNDKWLIECKNITPDKDKITIKYDWIVKNRDRADMYGKLSAIAWMPAGKADKFIIIERIDYDAAFGYSYDVDIVYTLDMQPKVHNVKNLIFHLDKDYIKDARKGGIIEIYFMGKYYYMTSLQKYKEMIT